MDFSDADTARGGPVVAVANWYRFRPREVISNPHVGSLFFIWAVQGGGTILCRGRRFDLSPGTLVRLPWRHAVHYEADAHHPFHVGSIHVIPWHSTDEPVVPRIPHVEDDALRDSPTAGETRPSRRSRCR
jgi:hypothetical protein